MEGGVPPPIPRHESPGTRGVMILSGVIHPLPGASTLKTPSVTRRQFIQSAAATAAFTAAPFARARRAPAHERVTIGVIGWGMMGPANTKSFLGYDDCQVVAACDIEKNHLQTAVDTINNHYGNKDCAALHDYRELLAR